MTSWYENERTRVRQSALVLEQCCPSLAVVEFFNDGNDAYRWITSTMQLECRERATLWNELVIGQIDRW